MSVPYTFASATQALPLSELDDNFTYLDNQSGANTPYTPAGTGTPVTTVQNKLREYISVKDYVTGGSGTSGDPWTGWDTSITWSSASYKQYNFCDGYFAYSTTITIPQGINWFGFVTSAGTVIQYNGSGLAMDIGGTGLPGVAGGNQGFNIRIATLRGNASATGGVRCRQLTRSEVEIGFLNFPSTAVCMYEGSSVLVTYRLKCSGGATLLQTVGIQVPTLWQNSSGCIYWLQAESCADWGIILNGVLNSIFYVLTSENCKGGLLLAPSNDGNQNVNMNAFYLQDFESNNLSSAAGYYDLYVKNSTPSSRTALQNSFFGGFLTSAVGSKIQGNYNTFYGTAFGTVYENGQQNSYINGYASAAFNDSGIGTTQFQFLNLGAGAIQYKLPYMNKNGAGAPTAVVPSYIGQVYINYSLNDIYIAWGTSAGNWTKVN